MYYPLESIPRRIRVNVGVQVKKTLNIHVALNRGSELGDENTEANSVFVVQRKPA